MHYFYLQIKEWIANTAHLTAEEEATYFRLILHYYDSEQKIPLEPSLIFRKLRIGNKDIGLTILDEFFTKNDDGWTHDRCDQEIARYHSMAEAGKRGALKRWAKGGDTLPIDPPIAIKNKELIIKNKDIKASPHAPKVAIPMGVSESVWNDFLLLRKTKKMAVTQTALKGIIREAQKANKALEEVLSICCERGWGGFKADWITESKSGHHNKNEDWRNNDGLMLAKANELGLHTVGLQRYDIINKIDATIRSRGL
jgi:uncharacterized protein YdaU (DUF1376 family)